MMKKVLILFLVVLVAACGKHSKKADSKPAITVSIEPQRYFTEALTKDFFKVECMVPKGSSPETYDPNPRQLIRLEKSAIYLRIGYIGFEQQWIDKLTTNAPHIEIFDTSKGVNLIMEPGVVRPIDHNLSMIEPHLWCSPKNAYIIAKNTLDIVTSFDRKHDKTYLSRYMSLCKRIAAVDSLIRDELKKPGADKAFAIYHPSLSYFARDYNLLQIPIEDNGKEPSPAQLADIISLCKKTHVKVVFIQPEFDRHNADIIARQIGAKVVAINPLNGDWDKEMIAIAKALSHTK
jgi:zinc transport system substrate-binding protein